MASNTALSWFSAWVRALTADSLASHGTRLSAAGPSALFGTVVARRTAPRGVRVRVDVSVLPRVRRVARSGWLISMNVDAPLAQDPGQCGSEGSGALDACPVQDAERPCSGKQLPYPGGCRELLLGERGTQGGDDRSNMDVLVGVYPRIMSSASSARSGTRCAGSVGWGMLVTVMRLLGWVWWLTSVR